MADPGNSTWKVQLNTGSGFSSMQNWGTTERMNSVEVERDAIRTSSNGSYYLVDMIDLNGDGLPDRVQADSSNTNWKVQWNTGSGFTTMENWGPIERRESGNGDRDWIRFPDSSANMSTDIFDLNGDGLPDRVQASDDNTVWKVQWNTGTGFTSMQDFGTISKMASPVTYSYPRWVDSSSGSQKVDVSDFDGDGLADRIQSVAGNTAWKVQKNKGPFPDLLKEIKKAMESGGLEFAGTSEPDESPEE
jgi:hypothetical protein